MKLARKPGKRKSRIPETDPEQPETLELAIMQAQAEGRYPYWKLKVFHKGRTGIPRVIDQIYLTDEAETARDISNYMRTKFGSGEFEVRVYDENKIEKGRYKYRLGGAPEYIHPSDGDKRSRTSWQSQMLTLIEGLIDSRASRMDSTVSLVDYARRMMDHAQARNRRDYNLRLLAELLHKSSMAKRGLFRELRATMESAGVLPTQPQPGESQHSHGGGAPTGGGNTGTNGSPYRRADGTGDTQRDAAPPVDIRRADRPGVSGRLAILSPVFSGPLPKSLAEFARSMQHPGTQAQRTSEDPQSDQQQSSDAQRGPQQDPPAATQEPDQDSDCSDD